MFLHAQTLFTYGKNAVGVDEFLRAYYKNKTPVEDREKSLREYVDLYVNFKLKVQAARDLRLDTSDQIIIDMQNFRTQVEDNYMSDEKGRDALIKEAIQRSFTEKHIIYFSLPVAADSLQSARAAESLYHALQKGGTDYKGITQNISTTLAPAKYSDVGFISVFALPYNFENIIYGLNPGEVSKPYKTKTAWHLFKVVEERKAMGKWKVAQILFSLPPSASDAEKAIIKKRADSVYYELTKGADFALLANIFSEDKLTYLSGGEMPEFSAGKYDPVFENNVMQLKHNGEITKPFLSPFGYHIVKRLGHIPSVMDKDDPALHYDIKQIVLRDQRLETSKQKFTSDIAKKLGYKRVPGVSEADLMRYADSVMTTALPENALKFPISNRPVISYNTGTVKGSDWLKFVIEYKKNYANYKGETNKELWDKFISYSTSNFYKKDMEKYNPDFKYQMKEFMEGNMLFEIMERNVWGLASTDSVGLRSHYTAHKSKYTWPASADVLIFNANSEQAAKNAMALLERGNSWSKVLAESHGTVQVDSGRYELTQIMGSDYTGIPEAGSVTNIIKTADSAALFVKFLKVYPPGQPRSFEESKGLVINDYQNVLEERWIAALKKKYPVKINQEALRGILKSAAL